jgi:hypothetical protein
MHTSLRALAFSSSRMGFPSRMRTASSVSSIWQAACRGACAWRSACECTGTPGRARDTSSRGEPAGTAPCGDRTHAAHLALQAGVLAVAEKVPQVHGRGLHAQRGTRARLQRSHALLHVGGWVGVGVWVGGRGGGGVRRA